MSWMQKLFETYEACSLDPDYTNPPQAEDGGKEAAALMPVSHTSQQAQICVTLDSEGNFQRAELLPPKTQFIIPATEDSAGRTSGDAPHPLCDKIHYCAKDYEGGKKNLYALYAAQLQAWCESPQAHPKAQAVYAYVSKGRLVRDLLACGILRADASGVLLTEPAQEDKEAGKDSIFNRLQPKKVHGEVVRDQGEALVVWSVVEHGSVESRTWKDDSLQQAWMQFSVFECVVDPAQWVALRANLVECMDTGKDSLRFYFLGANWKNRVEHVGAKPGYDPQGPLIL